MKGSAGGPATSPGLARASDFVLGIDFGGTKIALATAGAGGEILARRRLATRAEEGAPAVMRRTFSEGRALVAETAATGGRLLAAAAVTPGVVMDDRVELSPNLPGERKLALRGLLAEALGIDRVAVSNDVKAAGEAEARWGSLVGADPALFLNLGTGVSAALIAGGQVIQGARGAAGEIAYLIHNTFDDLAGQTEPRAPLEEWVGGRALGERAGRLLGREMNAAELFAAAPSDPRARLLIDEALSELALHLANCSVLLDPERIAVGGGFMGSADLILSVLRFKLDHLIPYPPQVVAARFVEDGALQGAVALALRTLQASS